MSASEPSRDASDAERLRCFVVATPGLEGVVADELRRLAPRAELAELSGGVELDASPELLARMNLELRAASRVLVRLGVVEARDFRHLRAAARTLPWERFVPPGRPLDTSVTARKCRLHHTGAVAERVVAAVADRLAEHGAADGGAADAPPQGIVVRGFRDRFEISVDASGELLHRRGWRVETASAPLRETLAAGILELCGWTGETSLVDPMCGSGTFAIEAALVATRRAPGLERSFAFEGWPGAWGAVSERARGAARLLAEETGTPPPILARDRDAGAVEVARRNAERAGVAGCLSIERARFEELEPPAGAPGLVLANPPYGKRARADRELKALYAGTGETLAARWSGWSAGVLVPDRALVRELRLADVAIHPLTNGGLRVWLVHGRVGGA